MVGTHPAATGWVPRGSGPEDLEQTDQDPGDGCERANDLAPRRGPAPVSPLRSRVTRTLLRHSPLTSSQQIDTLLNQAGVRGRLPWKALQLCHTAQHRKRVRSRKHGARKASAASASRQAAALAGVGYGPTCRNPEQTRFGAPAPRGETARFQGSLQGLESGSYPFTPNRDARTRHSAHLHPQTGAQAPEARRLAAQTQIAHQQAAPLRKFKRRILPDPNMRMRDKQPNTP